MVDEVAEVIVEADGGSRGNPGPAGYGAVVKALDGSVLAERRGFLGKTTNNVAEYQGLLAGLRAAATLGASTVRVRLDSKLVVEQMCGRWKIKNEQLRPLAIEARNLATRFATLSYEWIPRKRNADADRLANEAMDGEPDLTDPPELFAAAESAESVGVTESSGVAESSGAAGSSASAEPAEQQALFTEVPAGVTTNPPANWTGATGEPTRMLLLRHGQTERSVARKYSGRDDVPLTEVGAKQALLAGERLATMDGVANAPVISSPLERATQTANAVVRAIDGTLAVHDGLVETDFGAWEGLTFPDAAARDPEVHRRWLADSSVVIPGGESFDQVLRRVKDTADELIETYRGRTIVVVSHVTPIKQLIRLGLSAGPELLYRLHLDLAALSIVEFYPDGNASVRLVNDSSHLGS
ncbi:bifunctional RNase H/acid phosphatase [Tamaricihabitans halophyticus]|nr:bifunctional RNase H/acid phosphatase [Tamaricihabitans halophyticus]